MPLRLVAHSPWTNWRAALAIGLERLRSGWRDYSRWGFRAAPPPTQRAGKRWPQGTSGRSIPMTGWSWCRGNACRKQAFRQGPGYRQQRPDAQPCPGCSRQRRIRPKRDTAPGDRSRSQPQCRPPGQPVTGQEVGGALVRVLGVVGRTARCGKRVAPLSRSFQPCESGIDRRSCPLGQRLPALGGEAALKPSRL